MPQSKRKYDKYQGPYQLSLIKTLSGELMFVGSVPSVLAYVSWKGDTLTHKQIENELRLPVQYRKIKPRTFKTQDEAWDAYHNLT